MFVAFCNSLLNAAADGMFILGNFFRKYISSKYMLNYTESFTVWKGSTEKFGC